MRIVVVLPVHLALGHGQVETVKGTGRAEGFDQSFDLNSVFHASDATLVSQTSETTEPTFLTTS
jgi:hypothetical protein